MKGQCVVCVEFATTEVLAGSSRVCNRYNMSRSVSCDDKNLGRVHGGRSVSRRVPVSAASQPSLNGDATRDASRGNLAHRKSQTRMSSDTKSKLESTQREARSSTITPWNTAH